MSLSPASGAGVRDEHPAGLRSARGPALPAALGALALTFAFSAPALGQANDPARGLPRFSPERWSESASELRRLFPMQAEVASSDAPLSRLVLPAEVLAACRPDLSDLRLFDADGREVPFLLDTGIAPPAEREMVQRADPRIIEAARSEVRRETGPPLRRETLEIAMPGAAPGPGAWVLVIEPAAREFVARVDVEGLGAGADPVKLVQGGSLFRLPGARAAEKTRLALPRFGGERLRIVLETEHPFWLEPAVRLESARSLERGGRIAVPLEIVSSRSGNRRTVVDLARPAGIVPDLLRVESATGAFDRRVEVWDDGQAFADASIGSGRVFRFAAFAPAGETEIPLRPARGERLRVEIDDGDSPPLESPAFSAVIRQPSLVFPGRGAMLLLGGGRAHPPRYDLAGLLPPAEGSLTGSRARAAALLYDPETVRPASLGPIVPNPHFDRSPALAFAMRPGGALEPGVFSHVRQLTVPESSEGLSKLRIAPDDLAVLDEDLTDLRVADGSSRQWPYLLVRGASAEEVSLAFEAASRRGSASRYLLRPAARPLIFDRLILDTDAGFFDRTMRLTAKTADGNETTLIDGRLTRPAGDPRPVTLDFPPARATSLTLHVEDGDDAPLSFRSVRARVPLPELFVTAPAGRYTLLMGAPGHGQPHYELERLRDVVLSVQAAPIAAGPLEPNSRHSLAARLSGAGFRQTVLLWVTLIAAVLVLAWMTLRLARKEPPPPAR